MGKFKDQGGYDKVVKGRKSIFPKHNPKSKTGSNEQKESIYPSKKVQFNLNPMGPSSEATEDSKAKKPKSIINSVQFKASKRQDNKSTFLKLKDTTEKYSDIKQNLLKQINTVESTETTKETEAYSDVNFVTRPKTRLTNHVLKKILNQGVADQADKRIQSISSNKNTQITDIVGKRSINKKAKSQIKKNLWTQKIDLIKGQLKENAAKVKREKSVITGDMKPMLDSLIENDEKPFSKEATLDDGITGLVNLLANKVNKVTDPKSITSEPVDPKKQTKKERREKNLENEQAKAIQKQSIRFKKSRDDISLFGQLLDFKEFTSNPLDTLKKHFNA